MGEMEMRQEVPMWAALKLPEHKDSDGTKEYRPKKNRKHLVEPERVRLDVMAFMKRRGIALILIAAFAIYGWTVYAVTKSQVTKDVTAEVETRMRAGFAQYLRDQDYQNSAANFLTGEASFEAALDADSEYGARLIYGYLKNGGITLAQAKAIICCVEARVLSGYDSSFIEAVRHPSQWQWYSDDNPVRDEDKELVKTVLRDLRKGKFPNGFTEKFIYMEWTPGDIVLRDKWEKDSKTHYWRMPE